MILRLVIFNVLLNSLFVFSQQSAKAAYSPSEEFIDTTHKIYPADDNLEINFRQLYESQLEEFKNDPDFNYNNIQPVSDDWFTRLKTWVSQQLASLSTSKTYSTFLDIIYYGLMIIGLVLIIRGLIIADRRGLLFGKINKDEIKLSESSEELDKLNFDELFKSAVENNNYKLAIRYLFLKSLQLLAEKGMIELRENKTNQQYLLEIKQVKVSDKFRRATSRFEWVWYGDLSVDEQVLKSSQTEFNELFGSIVSG